MATPSLTKAIGKLAIAGEQAGLSVDRMIEMLNSGVSVETLLEVIVWLLGYSKPYHRRVRRPAGSCSAGSWFRELTNRHA
jgi:hypothetical protein